MPRYVQHNSATGEKFELCQIQQVQNRWVVKSPDGFNYHLPKSEYTLIEHWIDVTHQCSVNPQGNLLLPSKCTIITPFGYRFKRIAPQTLSIERNSEHE